MQIDAGARAPEPAKSWTPPAPQLLFVTGAPRSATTFMSDWITQSPHAYCAHEISREVAGMTDDQIMQHLWACAATGADRLGKVGIRDHMRWEALPRKEAEHLRVLGFKEPVFWPVQSPGPPHHADGFLRKFATRYVVTLRHPYDVVASGKHRATTTTTWPGFTTEEHARLWRTAVVLWRSYLCRGYSTLCIRWEQLLLDPNPARQTLAQFLGIDLPVFYGYERTQDSIEALRPHVSPTDGLVGGGHRHYLTPGDIEVIRSTVGDIAAEVGYTLAGP